MAEAKTAFVDSIRKRVHDLKGKLGAAVELVAEDTLASLCKVYQMPSGDGDNALLTMAEVVGAKALQERVILHLNKDVDRFGLTAEASPSDALRIYFMLTGTRQVAGYLYLEHQEYLWNDVEELRHDNERILSNPNLGLVLPAKAGVESASKFLASVDELEAMLGTLGISKL